MLVSEKVLDVLACPLCKGKLKYNKNKHELICRFHKLAFPVEDGVPVMIVERAKRYIPEQGS